MGVAPDALFAAYERRVLDSATPQAQQPVFQHLMHDRANNLDLMQFRQDAIAIVSFLTSPGTAGPISISIQTPWGAGKSPLMHQVRELLDANHDTKREQQDGDPEQERLSTRRVFKFLNTIRTSGVPGQRIDAARQADPARDRRLTGWFKAWRFESAEQVWAGLVGTVVTQVSARLAPVERNCSCCA